MNNELAAILERQRRRWGTVGSGSTNGDGYELSDIDTLLKLIEEKDAEIREVKRVLAGLALTTESVTANDWKENDALRAELGQLRSEREIKNLTIKNMNTAIGNRLDEIQRLTERCAELESERDRALAVLEPSMPESGLEDACRQLKQAHLSEVGNVETLEAEIHRLIGRCGELEQEIQSLHNYEMGIE